MPPVSPPDNSRPGFHLAREVASQPQDWLTVAARLAEVRALLPRPGERVAVVGCGTSLFVAQAYAARRESLRLGVTDAWPASEHRLDRGYDRVLALTRSGTTTEVLDILERYRTRVPCTVVTAVPDAPAASLSTPILLPEVDERSVVQTRFATSTLALLRAHLGEDLGPVAAQAQHVLEADEDSLGPAAAADQITFLGRDWTNGLANEAALKLRESAQLWTESYPAMEYRHGPISITCPGRVAWMFGEAPDRLALDVRATGGHFEHSGLDPMADLVRVHRLCLLRARRAGLDPDAPRHLSRSVVLS
jgi:fructoselysine-6-P-deglycase FrlB-like protein